MDLLEVLITFITSFTIVMVIMPSLIRKMREGGMMGIDVNKKERPQIPELGGIAVLFAFSISLSVIVGVKKLADVLYEPPMYEPPYLAAISVFFIAAMVGLIDDISNIKQRVKAGAVIFASLPILLVHPGDPLTGNVILHFPLGLPQMELGILGIPYLVYWLLIVPIGVTGLANAMNMSAGYNGLESGQVTVVSLCLLVVGVIRGVPDVSSLVFIALIGCSAGLFYFNRYPARVFVGDIGTLGLGAAMAAGVIMGHIEIFAVIAIAPAFYELFATIYFGFIKKVPSRREACHNPVLNDDGTLSPPKGAEYFTLAYFLLGRKPMRERRLVAVILGLYAISSAVAILLSMT